MLSCILHRVYFLRCKVSLLVNISFNVRYYCIRIKKNEFRQFIQLFIRATICTGKSSTHITSRCAVSLCYVSIVPSYVSAMLGYIHRSIAEMCNIHIRISLSIIHARKAMKYRT